MVIANLVLITIALVVMAILFFAMGELQNQLFTYKITDSDIRVLLFGAIPIYWIPFRRIKKMHEAPFYEVALVPGVHLFTRTFARRVVIEMRDKWFIFAFFTPDDPAAFIAEVKNHMHRSAA
jgi:hypothetical protein